MVLSSHHNRNKRKSSIKAGPRSEAQFDTKSYKDALQRAFNRAKLQIYFNPDMKYFVTLTYAGIQDSYEDVMYDLKQLVKQERRKGQNLKYIYVLEWQKRGSLHVHMITNNALTLHKNKNNHNSLTYWKHGYTSYLSIKDFDNNFKPYLYLFKYMRKAQRIGKTFIHSSRNLNNYKDISHKHINYLDWTVINQERTFTKLNNTGETRTLNFYRYYLKYDILPEHKKMLEQEKDYYKWQREILLYTRAKENSQENRLQH